MTGHTPGFWYSKGATVWSVVLSPLSWLYRLGRAVHCVLKRPRAVSGAHVVCLGNLNVGGSGKTPSALAVMRVISDYGVARRPVFVLRGYGGQMGRRPVRVDARVHSARDVGDEALLLAMKTDLPVYIARNRYGGAVLAVREGADMIVLDDGLQNRDLRPDTALAVMDAGMGFGNGCVLPAGPLREGLKAGLSRVDAGVMIGGDESVLGGRWPEGRPLFSAQLRVRSVHVPDPAVRYFAFAGLGYPEKFFRYLRETLKLDVVEARSFPDHHPYVRSDLESLQVRAGEYGAVLITTEKDMRRLELLEGVDLSGVLVLPVDLHFDDDAQILGFLRERLGHG